MLINQLVHPHRFFFTYFAWLEFDGGLCGRGLGLGVILQSAVHLLCNYLFLFLDKLTMTPTTKKNTLATGESLK